MAIKDILKETRLKKGLTQKEVEAMTGICHTSIYRYEEGINAINVEAIEKLANAYGVSPVYLADWRKYQAKDSVVKIVNKMDKLSKNQLKSVEILIDSFLENYTPPKNQRARK